MSTPEDKAPGQQEGDARKFKMTGLVRGRKPVATRRIARVFLTYLMSHSRGRTDDNRSEVILPPDCGTSVWGAAVLMLAEAGLIRRHDFVKSIRPERHGCHIGLWELAVEHAEVERWLTLHPDLPDPPEPDEGMGAPSPAPSDPPSPTPLAVALTQPTLF